MSGKTQRTIAGIICAITLAFTFVSCGFAVCVGFPQITEALSRSTCDVERSPFDADQLTQAALATRDYSFGSHNYDDLMDTMAAINDEAHTPLANESTTKLASGDESYVLTPDAISHLDDIYNIVSRIYYVLIGVAVIAAFILIFMFITWGSRSLAPVLIGSGVAILAIFIVLGIWALVSFNSLFAVFHSLFFASGSWTFSADSLLICSLPEDFWIGMVIIWLAVSMILSILSLVLGIVLHRRGKLKSN